MDTFNKFALINPEFVQGGDLSNTRYNDSDGSSGTDIYDSDEERIIYPGDS
jgi:hypothetical protein